MAKGLKRRRTDSSLSGTEPSTGESATTRDVEFWFEDGDVVLLAGDCKFRVYKEILSKHSPNFRALFSLPGSVSSAPPSQGTVSTATDACPVVRLDDSAQDLRHVLRVCMPVSETSQPAQDATPYIHVISAIIRVGRKYKMHTIVNDTVAHLKTYFNNDFAQWTKLMDPSSPFQLADAIAVVNLARLADEPSLLPTALLMCCCLDEKIVDGCVRADGTRETLARGDLGRCFAARTRLAEQMLRLALCVFDPAPSERCWQKEVCAVVLHAILLAAPHEARYFASPNVFGSWLAPFGPADLEMCCDECREMLEMRDRESRFEVWLRLPEVMGVEVNGW